MPNLLRHSHPLQAFELPAPKITHAAELPNKQQGSRSPQSPLGVWLMSCSARSHQTNHPQSHLVLPTTNLEFKADPHCVPSSSQIYTYEYPLFITHLALWDHNHETKGIILPVLKRRGWAVGAKVGESVSLLVSPQPFTSPLWEIRVGLRSR